MSAPGDDLRRYLIQPGDSSLNLEYSKDSAFGLNQDSALPPLPQTLTGPNAFLGNPTRNEASDMEIDHHPQKNSPTMSSHSQIFKLDDFVSANKDGYEAEKALKKGPSSSPSSSSSTPKPILLNNNNNQNAGNQTPGPLPVGARSSKNIVALFQKVQALALPQPTFSYRECGQNMWAADVSLAGLEELQGVTVDGGVFHSKGEAKEAVSKRALEVIEALERGGRVRKTRKAVNRSNVADGGEGNGDVGGTKEQQKNWIGLLLEYQNSTASPSPQYTDYSVGTLFTSLASIDGHATPFGSLSSLHASKKEARQAAAKTAVEYFQQKGLWPDTYTSLGGITKKKKKKTQPQNPQHSSPQAGNGSSPPLGPGATGSLSTPHLVTSLAHTLSLPTPEWRSTPHPSSPDFHSVACFFRGAGNHQGPIGEVRNMFGKKKAKEECARLTLEYLVRVREERVSAGMRGLGVDEETGRMGRGVRETSLETDGTGEFVDCT